MKIFCLVLLVAAVAGLTVDGYSQAQSEADRVREERDRRRAQQILDARLKEMRSLENRAENRRPVDPEAANERRMTKREWERRLKEVRTVAPADREKYKAFLREKRTGIFRLVRNADCLTRYTIEVGGECSAFMPGASDFSFRAGEYSDSDYHDIGYFRDQIVTDAFFSQGILVPLGDVPIESVGPAHHGLKFLTDFRPDGFVADARNTAARISDGVEFAGYRYTDKAVAAENTTYALRSVAYRIANPPLFSTVIHKNHVKFRDLRFKKRADVIIVFRVVRMEPDGGLTVVWKELGRADAPKITFVKGEEYADFKP